MSNLTILYLTANQLSDAWYTYSREKLREVSYGSKIISLSRKQIDFGECHLDTEQQSASNIYYQMLVGALAADTKYVGIAEDDTLYPPEHFNYEPPEDVFAYNKNRFGLFTWGRAMYFFKDRKSNSTLIAPRKLLIEALEERFSKYPQGTPKGVTGEVGRDNIADKLGLKRYPSITFESYYSIIRIDHEFGLDAQAKTHRKAPGMLKSFDIPWWGKASDIRSKFV